MGKLLQTREAAIAFAKKRLLRDGSPRIQLSVILFVTALTGFLTSFLLLQIEIDSMAFRYPFAVCISYCVFLLLLRIWLWFQRQESPSIEVNVNDLDGVDLPFPTLSSDSSADVDFEFKGGGDFSGGGAGGDWDEGGGTTTPAPVGFANTSSPQATALKTAGDSKSGGSSFLDGLDLDLDEAFWIAIIIIALAGAFIALFYVIYIAPVLLAEILVDGALAAGIYQRVKKIDRRYWLKTAVKKTILPVLVIAVCFSIAGYGMQDVAPEARSIGEFLADIFGG